MLMWLDGVQNKKGAINENYAREVMELFTLGADRGAYTETDVRELAKALSGWRADIDNERGSNFRFDPARFDSSVKTLFAGVSGYGPKVGNFGWEDAVRLCIEHPLHPSFAVSKLWSYFIPTPPPDGERRILEQHYVQSGYQIRPLVEAILLHPDLYSGPAHGQAAGRPVRGSAAGDGPLRRSRVVVAHATGGSVPLPPARRIRVG